MQGAAIGMYILKNNSRLFLFELFLPLPQLKTFTSASSYCRF